ncbi:YbaN family protein [Corynebacterium confusum]|uniref:YbaN family protein n=1 Tax=Corynebacterium confusum TaxID=71254 RepID=UPI0025B2FD4F|nr:YbaN family protein [Corynebacterium confusum]WJY90746.1 Inner membrane protein YbaN [Corynebacterium confusum]
MRKALLIGLGWVSVALAAIGVVLPLLPTTPFLLLSAFCFARSSERFHAYLYNHRVFGAYLRNYESGQMSIRHKIRTLSIMWIGILVSAALISKPIVWVVFIIIASCVTVHLWRLRPAESRDPARNE